MECQKKWRIKEEHVAEHLASKEVHVLSTPCMVLYMEATARECIDSTLKEGEATVGYRIDVKHLKPAHLGQEVVVNAKLIHAMGKRYLFYITVYGNNGGTLIGEAFHERRKITVTPASKPL